MEDALAPTALVRTSAAWIMSRAEHVTVDMEKLKELAGICLGYLGDSEDKAWDDEGLHYTADAADNGPLTAQFLFVVDAINFCFWPCPQLEYAELVGALKAQLEKDPAALDADRLAQLREEELASWYTAIGVELPELAERTRCLRQLGVVLRRDFGGLALNLVRAAGNSAVELVHLITGKLPAFRDESMYRGRQVFFYKRAQILVADLWGAYGKSRAAGDGPCAFPDIAELTTFADYRVPQVLRHVGVLKYDDELSRRVDAREEVRAGSDEEVELRAATIMAVEHLRQEIATQGPSLISAEVDWILWCYGEERRDAIGPHHRCLSIFY